jgi:hypothetical protein
MTKLGLKRNDYAQESIGDLQAIRELTSEELDSIAGGAIGFRFGIDPTFRNVLVGAFNLLIVSGGPFHNP